VNAFCDTSAFIALFSRNDPNLQHAKSVWRKLIQDDARLVTTNYVLVETISIMQRRMGMQAVRDFELAFKPELEIVWVDETMHERAMAIMSTLNERNLSLVDCISFVTMRAQEITDAFAFDRHFAEQGFRLLPPEFTP
jgi:uncharacterized protein